MMKKGLFLLSVLVALGAAASENFLQNTNCKEKDAVGRIAKWSILHGKVESADGGFSLSTDDKNRAVMLQHIPLPPEKLYRVACKVISAAGNRYRIYLEYFQKQENGKSLYGGASSNWQKGDGKETQVSFDAQIKFPYTQCYLVFQSEGKSPTIFRNPELVIAPPPPVLRNTDFKELDQKGNPKNWVVHGGKLTCATQSADIVMMKGGGNVTRIVQGLQLKENTAYRIRYEASSPVNAVFRCYCEWYAPKDRYCSVGTDWKTAGKEWGKYSFEIAPARNAARCIVVIQSKDGAEVRFRNLSVESLPSRQVIGGLWQLNGPCLWTEKGVIVSGQKGSAGIEGISVTSGKRYSLSYTACGMNDSGSTTGFHEIGIKISPPVMMTSKFEDVPNSPQKKTLLFTVPQNHVGYLTLSCVVNTPGKVRFSDFSLEEAAVDPAEQWMMTLNTPFYRNTIFPNDKFSAASGVIEADTSAVRAEVSFNGGKALPVAMVKGKGRFSIPVSDLKEGKYPLTGKVFGSDGKFLKEFKLELRKYTHLKNYWKVRPDRYLERNGRALFPVVVWNTDPYTPGSLYFWGRRGANVTLRNAGATPQFLQEKLDIAYKAGFLLMIHPGCPFEMKTVPQFKERIKKIFTPEILNHPAFLGYFLTDEPLWAGHPVEPIRAAYDFLCEFDPGHVVWINAAPRNEIEALRPYARSCDIYGVDIYPVPIPNGHSGLADKSLNCVGTYAARMNEAAEYRSPIWNALQGFAWHECGTDPWNSPKKPYPTLTESRFMAWTTMVNGGTGYGLWGAQYIQNVKFYELLGDVTREMHRFSGLFVHSKQLPDVKGSNPLIRCAVLESNGNPYYVFLNLSDHSQTGTFPINGNATDFRSGKAVSLNRILLEPWGTLLAGAVPLPAPAYSLVPVNSELEREGNLPYKNYIEDRYRHAMNARYQGGANWVWDNRAFYAGAEVWIMKDFYVDDTAVKAEVLAVADDSSTLYCNGIEIGKTSGHANMGRFILTRALKKGRNLLAVKAQDGGALPCGVLAELRLGDRKIVTDGNWKTLSGKEFKGIPSLNDFDAKAFNADVICSYGGGAWGNQVRIVD